MNDIEELRRALGPLAQQYTEPQLQQLSRELELASEFLLELYIHKQPERRAVLTERGGSVA